MGSGIEVRRFEEDPTCNCGLHVRNGLPYISGDKLYRPLPPTRRQGIACATVLQGCITLPTFGKRICASRLPCTTAASAGRGSMAKLGRGRTERPIAADGPGDTRGRQVLVRPRPRP